MTADRPKLSTAPKWGGYLGLLAGAAMFVAGVLMLAASDRPKPLIAALLGIGACNVVSCWFALQGQRLGWSFALAINGGAAIVLFFGSARLRDAFNLVLALAFVPAFIHGMVVALLAAGASEFES